MSQTEPPEAPAGETGLALALVFGGAGSVLAGFVLLVGALVLNPQSSEPLGGADIIVLPVFLLHAALIALFMGMLAPMGAAAVWALARPASVVQRVVLVALAAAPLAWLSAAVDPFVFRDNSLGISTPRPWQMAAAWGLASGACAAGWEWLRRRGGV